MRKTWPRASIGIFAAAAALCLQACARPDPAVGSCGSVMHMLSDAEAWRRTGEIFPSLDFETQYRIFICGGQAKIPGVDFSFELAAQGSLAAGPLREKLRETRYDPTIHDIAYVFSLMDQFGYYDVAHDVEIMQLLDRKINAMTNAQLRGYARRHYDRIRARRHNVVDR